MSGAGRSVVSVGLAIALGVGSAWAQQPVSAIEQQHRRGVAMLRQGQNEQALGVFREIYERTREPRALWRMATAEAALGRWVEAEGHMSSAFGSSSDEWVQSQRAGLEQTLRQVQARVGLLTVRCNVPGASIEVDGRAVTSFPLRVVAGDVRVRVTADGYQAAETTVSVPGNVEQAFVREVNLLQNPDAGRPDSARSSLPMSDLDRSTGQQSSEHRQGPGAGPWILMGIGGAAVVSGGIFLVVGEVARGEADDVSRSYDDRFAAEGRRLTYTNGGQWLLVAGGATVVGGLLWRLLAGGGGSASGARVPTVAVIPSLRGAEIVVGGEL